MPPPPLGRFFALSMLGEKRRIQIDFFIGGPTCVVAPHGYKRQGAWLEQKRPRSAITNRDSRAKCLGA